MNYNFDLDLRDGLKGESDVGKILLDPTIEVKTDFMTKSTGNIVVEFNYRGKDSGIAISKAQWWLFNLAGLDTMILIRTSRLRQLVLKGYPVVRGGDDMASSMFLIPVSDLSK